MRCLPSGDGRPSFLSSTSCSISFFRSSWSMAVESKASLTNSETPGLVDISSSSSCCGWEPRRKGQSVGSRRNTAAPSGSYLLDVTDGNWRSFGPNLVYKNKELQLACSTRGFKPETQIALRYSCLCPHSLWLVNITQRVPDVAEKPSSP